MGHGRGYLELGRHEGAGAPDEARRLIQRPFWRASIAWRLPILAGAIALIVAFAMASSAYVYVRRQAIETAGQRLGNVMAELVLSIETSARGTERDMRTAPLDSAGLAATMARDTSDLSWQVILPTGDTILVGTPPANVPADAAARVVDRAVRSADSVAISPLFAHDSGLVFAAAAMRRDAAGRLLRVIAWERSTMNSRTRSQIPALVGPGATFALGGRGGVWTDLAEILPAPASAPTLDSALRFDGRLGDRIVSARASRTTPWNLVLEQPLSTVVAPAQAFLGRLIAAALVLSVLALGIAWWQGRRISAPLREFTGAAMSMTSADYSRRVNVAGHDELAQLAIAFNAMAERVEDEVSARFRAELQWRNLFSFNPLPMWVVDTETLRFLAVNDAAIRHYGYAEAEFLAMTIDDIRPPEDVAELRRTLSQAGDAVTYSRFRRHRRKDGSLIDVEVTSSALIFEGRQARLALAQDVTARRALEADLRQIQKMEAVGRLAAGVAHDFNNVLAVILSYAELLRSDLPPGDTRTAELDEIMRAARHAGTLTRQLLAFSRQQVVRPVVIDLAETTRSLERMIRPLLGPGVEYTLLASREPTLVMADPAQLEQVLLNLVINARDAMPSGGRLVIETGLDGAFVTLTVRDTGIGMTDEVRARIFEPFFTTKEEGKGTGLGLATVYGIVAQAGGRVDVQSAPGQGATFTVYLPQAAEKHGPAARISNPELAPSGGTGTILVVDDEPAVLGVVANILRRNGFSVLTASSGEEAIRVASGHGTALDMLLSDVVMPGIDGPTLLARLRERQPGLRAMFMSGYAGEALRGHDLQDVGVPFLEKPFTMAALLEKLREARG